MSKTMCHACGRDYSENLFALHYCLCDTSVCDDCIESEKVQVDDQGKYQCPSCRKWLSVEDSLLIAPE